MIIEKNGVVYTVREYKNIWKLTRQNGGLIVDYSVNKNLCATFEDLKAYVLKENVF